MKRLTLALLMAPLCGAFFMGPALAQKTKAQLNTEVGTTFPDNTTGQITPSGVRNFQNDVINSIMPTAPVGDGNFACYDGTTGLLKDCGSAPSSAFVSNSNIIPGPANTFKGSLDGSTTSDIALTACSLAYQIMKWVSGTGWQCGINPVLPSRATAATLDLSAHTVVQTLGFASGGDGGGATFKNIGATQFPEVRALTGTISRAGTGCTDGSYSYQRPTGGTGSGLVFNVTVSGNVMTAATIVVNAGGSAYSVGDVLTFSLTGCSVQPQWTVATVSTPVGSFTDAAGNHWAYVPGVKIDARQFGYVADSSGSGSSGTDNSGPLKAALNYAATLTFGLDTNSGVTGATVVLPAGIGMICGSSTITIYGGTMLQGQGPAATSLHLCNSFPSASAHIFTMCDPVGHLACFGAQIADLRIEATATPSASANVAMIYSNNVQQARALSNVEIYAGNRACFYYETGYGGAAMLSFYDVLCTMFSGSVNAGITINAGTTIFKFEHLIVEGTNTGNGMNLLGGQIVVKGFHTEGIATGIDVNMSTSSHSFTLMHATGGASCSELVKLESTNSPGNFAVYDAVKNGCTNLVTNGQPAGSNRNTDARPKDGWISFNP